ncbi:hypothetical protein [Streptomyces melanogenes]|uniref:hypothetical protein n=1 Tax=Streptomyces melanogenes TaxID=67326 RepID=UPI00378A43FC
MTVSITSRYRRLEIYPATDATGTTHPTVPIRRTPARAADDGGYQHRMTGAESIEYLAWQFLGSSEEWWRLADANATAFPLRLGPGDAVTVPTAQPAERVLRSRVF